MRQDITLHVNGKSHTVNVEPDTPLIYILRNDLGLKGVKAACGLEQCGACDVIVDGAAVPSCQLEVHKVQGLKITTIEGLGTANHLHPLQEAFIEEQAIQCGYCAPGMIVAAQGLLNRTRYPSDAEIREALANNLCRCGAHERIRRAIKLRIARPDAGSLWEVIEGERIDAMATGSGPLPPSLQRTPDLDRWIRINTDETITLFAGKVEYGQGIKTAFAQLVAEEMDVPLDCIEVIAADSAITPDEGNTTGSRSLETTGNAIRVAAAEARSVLLNLAFEELEAGSVEQLVVKDGVIRDPESGRQTTYWALMGGQLFGQQISGRVAPKGAEAYHVVGQAARRVDLIDKVTGQGCFVQDLDLSDMAYGRIVRPPAYRARLIEVDTEPIRQMAGVLEVVRDGDFLGVIAEREEQAEQAAAALRQAATWETSGLLPPQEALYEDMQNGAVQSFPVVEGTAIEGGAIPPLVEPKQAAHTVRATYTRPYHLHAALAPSAGAAQFEDGRLTVWTHSQGVFPLRAAIASALNIPEDTVRVIQVEGSGCYGHNGADDAAFDAVLLARALAGRPVLVRWSRVDENQWEPCAPAMIVQMQASLNAEGDLLDWNHDVWSYEHLGRAQPSATASGLLGGWHIQDRFERPEPRPALSNHVGGHRNADPLYTFPKRRIVKHFAADSPLRTSSFRGLGAYANIFAIESFVDEVAQAAGIDPVDFRLRYLNDERARAVIEAAAEKAGWGSDKPTDREAKSFGRGMAFARYKNKAGYAAVVVELTVDKTSGNIQLERAVIAADSGQIVNPDGLSNQLEGGFLQAASLTLKEQVQWNEAIVTSADWESYPILRFADAPILQTVLINQPGSPFLGSGEISTGPTPAAIANAVYDAVGVRLRDLPFVPERVLTALEAIGRGSAPPLRK